MLPCTIRGLAGHTHAWWSMTECVPSDPGCFVNIMCGGETADAIEMAPLSRRVLHKNRYKVVNRLNHDMHS